MDRHLRAVMERIDRVENESFVSLYEDAPPELNAGFYREDGVQAVWLGSFDDAGFSSIAGIDAASDPETTLAHILERAEHAGVKTMGMEDHPDLDPRFDRQWFAAHGFQPDHDEQIWWRPLDDVEAQSEPDGVRIVPATPLDRDVFAAVLNEGFGADENAGLGRAFAAVIGKEGWHHYIAEVDGEPGSAAAMFVSEGVADCFVASTRSAARRRGAQTALINRRMLDGREAGCDIATAQSVTDNASPRNFERHGFLPVYRRTIYSRQLDRSR
ncbi:hypothetical protein BH23CHL2_BH23CHL2_06900 [soil metagenome]